MNVRLAIQAQSQINVVKFIEACSYAILYYDYLLTVDLEIERFWQRPKRSIAALLFFLNRYAVLLGYVPYLVIFARPDLFSHDNKCLTVVGSYFEYHVAISHVIIAVILVVRTSALFANDRRVLYALSMLLAAIVVNGVGLLIVLNRSHELATAPDGVNIGCHSLYTQSQGVLMAAVWSGLLVLDVVVFVLASWKSYTLIRDCPWSSSLWTALLRDGAIYFGILSITNLSNILMLALAPTILKIALPQFINVLASSMMSRLMLNLRDQSLQRTHGLPTTRAVEHSIRFAAAAPPTTLSTIDSESHQWTGSTT